MDVEARELQSLLSGTYRFERELGRGGMGVVYLARDVILDRLVAIKVLPSSLAERSELRERFLREARTAAQLSHPHIVPIYRADEAGGHAYFVMAYIDGESLAERVATRGPMSPADAVRYLREVAWALSYAHARGVVHRDIKPENIMIERGSGRALVTDFGIARADTLPSLTAEGNVLGTVHYMSPEQIQGEPLDGRSDQYSLGVLGFYLLSARLPFEGLQPSAVLVAHATRPAPPLASVASHVPAALAAVVDRCLAKRREERFSWEEFFEAITGAMAAAESDAAFEGSGPHHVLSEAQAMQIWRRAAQLQAEAAQRLEQRARGTDSLAVTAGTSVPTDGFRVREVEAAAVEAGISRVFVALAVAELPKVQANAPDELAGWQERAAARWFGSTQQSLSASRVIRATPRRTLQAIGRVLPSPPLHLVLQSQVGPHPLDGGVLVFDLPPMHVYPHGWTYTRYGVYALQVRVMMRSIPNDPRACEVSLYIDLRRGLKFNLYASGGITAGASAAGGGAAALIAVKALALAGAAIALPVLGGVAAVGALSAIGFAAGYRYAVRKAKEELEAALRAIENDVTSEALFGSPSPPSVSAVRRQWDDVSSLGTV